jgi:hypothetical protein
MRFAPAVAGTINYTSTPQFAAEVKRLTGGKGVSA